MSNQRSNTFISKKMSYCLRHNPAKYGLKLDEYGFVDLQDFINAMNHMHHFQPKLNEMKIREIIYSSNKKRFEIKNGRIRALYGHSVPGIIKRREAVPPKILYHGTAHRFLPSIQKEGLLPMGRQYVHLSADIPWPNRLAKEGMIIPLSYKLMLVKLIRMAFNFILAMKKSGYAIMYQSNI